MTHTTQQYATRFYNLDSNNTVTYMSVAACDLYATREEAYAWGQQLAGGLHDGFVIETVTS